MLDPFGYQQNVNIFAIKVKCLDPKTYADRERKTLSFFINKLAKFLQDFLFATAFKGAYIKKKKKKRKKKKKKMRRSFTCQIFLRLLSYSGVFITDAFYMSKSKFTRVERKVFTFDFLTRSDHSKRG